ncbi:hypothetical protein Hypma_005047 [Hypsizygus marmoreus]|uniref:Protein-S-isoprenylcysteine O-methyltransferase n=1 Tax=Hypsizygus marmoreus TaxID=39966 RepID=A0A369K2Y3_HYPMA|nr:hypothetical protein Hypma_005047 [Hypsizygus marmoreus]
MMQHPLLKAALTGFSAVGYWYSLTPPSYPSSRDKLHVDGIFGFVAHGLSIASKTAVVASLLCQIAVIVALQYPGSVQSSQVLIRLCHSAEPLPIGFMSPLFVIGSSLVISMALVRAWCFHTLGNLFTFQITIRHDHRLIRTGPYAFVRHPAYTALILVIIGVNIMSLDRKGWIRQCDMMGTQVGWWVEAFLVLCVFSIVSMVRRGEIEDERLKKIFNEEWLAYSRDVPWKFIPGIL